VGLEISLDAFKKMKAMDRDVLIYQNVIATKRLLSSVHTNRKISYAWLSALTAGLAFLGKVLFNIKN